MIRAAALLKRGIWCYGDISLGTDVLKVCLECHGFHSTPKNFLFFEKDPKSGYNKNKQKPSHLEIIKKGFQQIKGEIKLWRQEIVESFEGDLLVGFQPG